MENAVQKKKMKATYIIMIINIAMISASSYIMKAVFGYSYLDEGFLKAVWIPQTIYCIFIFFVIKKYYSFEEVGFRKINKKGFLPIIPNIIVILLMLLVTSLEIPSVNTSQKTLIISALGGTLLVGFTEEVMFRGVLLQRYLENGQIKKGIIISSLMFSLMHCSNILSGQSIAKTGGQLVVTFIMGLFFATISVKLNNIVVPILYHFLWDFSVISLGIIGINNAPLLAMLSSVANVLGIIVMVKILIKEKFFEGKKLEYNR
ncbi:CPBP family intramembrane glutamic endopeptidase [Clostridium oceanicum]|uniref:CPBP family intramembrane metalloprotease n=1 Tax=Clostridium oceanicum TaxID=1543 RepID=A0ABN1JJX1_9CLOT